MNNLFSRKERNGSYFIGIFAILCFGFACFFLHETPFHFIGSAFCHQISARSPSAGFPFCYRCSGLFFGIFWGELLYFLRSEKKLFQPADVILFFAGFVLFITDILNSSKFPFFFLYPETILMRFLSSWPLGFMISQFIMRAFTFLSETSSLHFGKTKIGNVLLFFTVIICVFLSALMTFSANLLVLDMAGLLLSVGCVVFLTLICSILNLCIHSLKNKKIDSETSLVIGISIALIYITVIGTVHNLFFDFEHFFI